MANFPKMNAKVHRSITFYYDGSPGRTYKTARNAADHWTAHSMLRIADLYDNRHNLCALGKNHERFFNTHDYGKIRERHWRRAYKIFKKMLEE